MTIEIIITVTNNSSSAVILDSHEVCVYNIQIGHKNAVIPFQIILKENQIVLKAALDA
jgi:hypothetical protein